MSTDKKDQVLLTSSNIDIRAGDYPGINELTITQTYMIPVNLCTTEILSTQNNYLQNYIDSEKKVINKQDNKLDNKPEEPKPIETKQEKIRNSMFGLKIPKEC
jgi:hypothetical protein